MTIRWLEAGPSERIRTTSASTLTALSAAAFWCHAVIARAPRARLWVSMLGALSAVAALAVVLLNAGAGGRRSRRATHEKGREE